MEGISRRDMMAISRSDRAQNTNRLADLKEEFETRESQTVKKKNSEIKRNQKKHEEELKETRKTYESKISDMQNKFYERLSDRDRDHQKKIEDVRGVYVSQMRKKMEDSQDEKSKLTENYETEKEYQAKIAESQKNLMKQKFNDELQNRNQTIDDIHQSSQANMQETLAARAKKMRLAHEKEKNILVDTNMDEKQKAYDERESLRRFYSGEINNHKKTNQRQKNNWENKYQTTVQALNAQYGDELQVRDKLLKQEVNKSRKKFENKYNELEDRIVGRNDSFRDAIDSKYNDQVRVKDSEIYRLKNRMYVDQINQKKRDGVEKQHVIDDYEKKLGIYEKNLDDQRGVFKELGDKRISKMNEISSNILQETMLKNKVGQNLVDEKHRQDRAAVIEQNKNALFNTQNTTSKRVDTIQKLANDRETRLVNYYGEYLDSMKEGYLEKIFEQREKHDRDIAGLNSLLGDKFRKLKQTYEQRLDRVTRGFEDKIAKIQDDHSKEIKSRSKLNEIAITEKNKSIDNTKNEVEDKYESRIKTLQEQYRAQIDRMSDRHQEELKALSARMQNYSRKA